MTLLSVLVKATIMDLAKQGRVKVTVAVGDCVSLPTLLEKTFGKCFWISKPFCPFNCESALLEGHSDHCRRKPFPQRLEAGTEKLIS